MPTSLNRRYLPEVDQLRAFAVLLVLFYHGFAFIGAALAHGGPFNFEKDWVYSLNPLVTLVQEGHTGVGLFIVLSGFILSVGVIGNEVNYRLFIIARILRIYPMLILCLVVAAYASKSSVSSIVISLLPLGLPGGVVGNVASMFWAVHVEFQCYLLFPFLIGFSNRIGTRYLLQVIALLIVMRIVAVLDQNANARHLSYFTIVGRLDQFCIGIIAARHFVVGRSREVPPWLFLPAAAAAVGMLWVFNQLGGWPAGGAWKIVWPTLEGAVWAGFIVTYIAAGRYLPRPLAWAATKLGEVSYSFYLLHLAVVFIVLHAGLFVRLTGNAHRDAALTTLLVVLPITAAIAVLAFQTVEQPFLSLRRRYVALSGQGPASGPPSGADDRGHLALARH